MLFMCVGEGLPPWFNAAVESGVIFYDPEGEEVVVPSSKAEKLGTVCKHPAKANWGRANRHQINRHQA